MNKISVIIPAHNEEDVIESCLTSLKNQDCEIILVNDGSTDKTESIARKTGIPSKIISFKSGHSAAFARNRGAEAATGDFLIFIDADQIAEASLVKKIKEFLDKNPADASDYLVLSNKPENLLQRGWLAYRKAYPSMGLIHIIRHNVFKKLGGFDEKIFYYEDNMFMEKFHKNGYKFKGPINSKVYHIEPKTIKDFIRQRKWQSRMAAIKYFIPCFFPPLMLFQYAKISFMSKDPINTFFWIILDIIGRYVSLKERILNIVSGKNKNHSLKPFT